MSYLGRFVGALGVLGVLAGCAATLPAVPGKGGPKWLELTSDHFTMWTDADPGRAHELVREMERLRQVIGGVAFPSAANAGKILVIALRDDQELSMLSPRAEARALAFPAQAPLWQPTIVLSVFSNRTGGDEVVTHELAHAISFAAIRHQPRWLSEGMAQYFETLQIDANRTTVDVGVAPQTRGQPRRIAHLVPISTLFAWQTLSDWSVEQRRYSTAWALFTFLVNEHRGELLRYLQLLDDNAGPADESTAERGVRVWNQAFPSLSYAAVDGELRQWLVSGHHVVLHFNLQPRDWRTTERTLTDADVHAVRGLLLARAKRESAARDNLDAALAIEPTHVLARLVGVAHYKVTLSLAQGRAIAAAHREDWRAWWLAAIALFDAEGETAEEVAAEIKACELIAKNPAVIAPPKLCPAQRAPAASR